MVTLSLNKNYSRYNNILYEDDIPIIKFTEHKFPDWGLFTAANEYLRKQGIIYMQKYMRMFPEYFITMAQDRRIKKFYYDTETTGLNYKTCSIHQLACWIEIDGEVIEKLNLSIKPHEKATYEDNALKTHGITKETMDEYPDRHYQFNVLRDTLKKYVDPYAKGDKFFFVGFKNASFDDDFIKKYFELEQSQFWLYFYPNSIDVSCLAAEYLINTRYRMSSFKLKRVAIELGIKVDETKLHDADYDVYLTREIYLIVTGRKQEEL